MASNYDEYMKELEDGRKDELAEAEKTYGDMSKDYEEGYDKQIEGLDDFEKEQTDAQNESYDFTIEQIKQQKEVAEKDYQKEQTAAYRDYEKQIDPYGVHAEQIAANGLDKSGYSESSKVAMYKAYQNRVSVARESYEKATTEFENAMTQARLQNDVSLAEIAYNTYQQKLQLTLQKLQTKNSLLLELMNKKASINSTYNSLYADALEAKAGSSGTAYTDNTGLRIVPDDVSDESDDGGNSSETNNGITKAAYLKTIGEGRIDTYGKAKVLIDDIASDISPKLLGRQDWYNAKKAGKSGSEFEGVNSYEEYLQYYCTWAVNTYM